MKIDKQALSLNKKENSIKTKFKKAKQSFKKFPSKATQKQLFKNALTRLKLDDRKKIGNEALCEFATQNKWELNKKGALKCS